MTPCLEARLSTILLLHFTTLHIRLFRNLQAQPDSAQEVLGPEYPLVFSRQLVPIHGVVLAGLL